MFATDNARLGGVLNPLYIGYIINLAGSLGFRALALTYDEFPASTLSVLLICFSDRVISNEGLIKGSHMLFIVKGRSRVCLGSSRLNYIDDKRLVIKIRIN